MTRACSHPSRGAADAHAAMLHHASLVEDAFEAFAATNDA
jgi:hypothetical protein